VADAPSVTIPDKPAFKASEVCELAQIQPYVLRSWESEFPELGLSKTPGGPRIYRRSDVERVLRIRDLVFTEGLTVSGVRRRFESEQPPPQDDLFTFVAEMQAAQAKAQATAERSTHGAPKSKAEGGTATPTPRAEGAANAPGADAATLPIGDAVPAPGPAAEEVLPQEARAKIVQLKQEMRSLLDMLGGSDAAAKASAPATPAAPASKRARRTPHA
jgi:DNA-binding transcriptional MerR regulator